MSASMVIREATLEDVAAITNIYNEVIEQTNAIYRETPVDESERIDWFQDKRTNGFPVIVATENNEIIGYGVYGSFRFGEGYAHTVEHSVHVLGKARGKGTGSKLLEELIAIAMREKRHVMVAAIDSTNSASISLHRKYGFIESARMPEIAKKNGLLLDLVLMQKIL